MSSFRTVTVRGITYLRSGLLSCRHGFSTRLGGVSTEPHTAQLNLAFGRGDPEDIVRENLRRFAGALEIDPESIVSMPQIHSTRVIYADESLRGEGCFKPPSCECDGYVADRAGIALGVKTADCVPILLEDPMAGVIGAVHAGWRGTAAGIAGVCVDKMCSLGAKPERIRAAIGPAIHFCCYEVGEDFIGSVAELAGADAARRFIRIPDGGTKPHADIVGLNESILLSRGLRPDNIDICELCTCHTPELFYSHRASHGLRGTMLSLIAL